jgi:hypothetical protein
MPERTRYDPGTPSWVDLSTTDLDSALRFYGDLFGWEFQDLGEEAGHYHDARLGLWTVPPRCPPTGSRTSRWTTSTTRSNGCGRPPGR